MAEYPIVWENTVDGGKWGCRVVRTEPYKGRLTVWNVASGESILEKAVGLAYDAKFGPDVDDLYQWQETIIAAIDKQGVTE